MESAETAPLPAGGGLGTLRVVREGRRERRGAVGADDEGAGTSGVGFSASAASGGTLSFFFALNER